jgi:hypothetical protein
MNKRLLLKNKNMKFVFRNIRRAVVVLVVHQPKQQVKVQLKHRQANVHQRSLLEKKEEQQLNRNHRMKIMMTMMMMSMMKKIK